MSVSHGWPRSGCSDSDTALVVFRAVPRPGASSTVASSPVTFDGGYLLGLLVACATTPSDTFEPGALRPVLQAAVGRARGRDCGRVVALLKLVLLAEAHDMVLCCA